MTSNSFLTDGGDGYPEIPDERLTKLGQGSVPETVSADLMAQGSISPVINGRITCIDSDAADPFDPNSEGNRCADLQ